MAFAKVLVYGKEGCPHTKAAMEYYTSHDFGIEYFDVEKDNAAYHHCWNCPGARRWCR